MKSIGFYGKEISGASIGALLILIAGLQDDGNLNLGEWSAAAAAFLGGLLLTSFVTNAAAGFWYYAKAWIQGLIAAAGAFGSAMSDGVGWPPSSMELLMIVVAFLGGAGITSVVSKARTSDADAFSGPTTTTP